MTDRGRLNALIASAVLSLRSDIVYGPRLSKRWLPALTWAEALVKSGHIDASLVSGILDDRKFNVAMSKSILFGGSMTRFDGTKQTGVFQVKYAKQYFYWITEERIQVPYPSPLNRTWKEKVVELAANILAIPTTRARPCCLVQPPQVLASVGINSVLRSDITNDSESEESPNKRQRTEDAAASHSYWPFSPEAHQYCLSVPYARSNP
jgi:hypothetical protein